MSRLLRPAWPLLLLGCFLEPGEHTLTVQGVVLPDAGVPVGAANVELVYRAPFSSWSEGARLDASSTGSDGRYVIVLAPPRTHDTSHCNSLFLEVTAPGYARLFPQGISSNADGSCDEGTIEVAPIRLSTVDG